MTHPFDYLPLRIRLGLAGRIALLQAERFAMSNSPRRKAIKRRQLQAKRAQRRRAWTFGRVAKMYRSAFGKPTYTHELLPDGKHQHTWKYEK